MGSSAIAFYISGHGFGHATRSAAVIAALRKIRPNCRIAVRTAAPRMLFGSDIDYFRTEIDGTVVESADALHVDATATADAAAAFVETWDSVIERETGFLNQAGVSLIVGDIPPVAGAIAKRMSLPAIAIGNFTWNWILDGFAPEPLLERMRDAYSGYTEALRLPLSHKDGWDALPRVRDVPLVTPRSSRPREEIREELDIAGTAVLIAGRSRLSTAVLDRVRCENPAFRFLTVDSHPVFSDLVRAADIVVSKIGYSTAAECIAEKARLVYPPRTGFREEHVLAAEVPLHVPALPIPVPAWQAGDWKPSLEAVLELPYPESRLSFNGDDVCAAAIASRLP